MAQTASVTGQRLTSGRTTFTIADSAKAKASGEYGNYLTNQVAFTFGQLENKKANTVKRVRKSRRTSKPLWDNPIAHSHGKSSTHQQTESDQYQQQQMWSGDPEREHCPRPL